MLLFCFFQSIYVFSQAPVHSWIRSVDAPFQGFSSGEVKSVADNSSQQMVVQAGIFSSSMTIGGTSYSSNGGRDVFVAAYSYAGALLWVHTFGTADEENVTDLHSAPDGSIYLTATYGSGPNSTLLTVAPGILAPQASGNSSAGLIVRFRPNGTVRWARGLTSVGNTFVHAVTINPANGHPYIAGSFIDTLRYGGIVISTGNSTRSGFIAHLDTAAVVRQVFRTLGFAMSPFVPGPCEIQSIDVNAAGNKIFAGGHYQGGHQVASLNYNTNGFGFYNGLMISADTNLTNVSSIAWGFNEVTLDDQVLKVSAGQNGFVYAAGIEGSIVNGIDVGGYFLAKYNASNLTQVWRRKSAMPPANGSFSMSSANGLHVSSTGEVTISGIFLDSLDLPNGKGLNNPFSNSFNLNAFVAWFNSSGTCLWSMAPLPSNSINRSKSFDVSVDLTGGVYYGGSFYGSNTFGNLSITASIDYHFLAKMGGTLGVANASADKFSLDIYPNPAKDALTLTIGDQSFTHARIEVYSLDGRMVQQHQLQDTGMGSTHSLSLEGLNAGTYMIIIHTDKGTMRRKLIKE